MSHYVNMHPCSGAENLINRDITQAVLLQIKDFIESDEPRRFKYERLRDAIEKQMGQHDLSSIDRHLRISAEVLGSLLALTGTLGYENTRRSRERPHGRALRELEHNEEVQAAYLETILELQAWRSFVQEAKQAGIEQLTHQATK
jgi:hypothetical protein